MKLLVFSVKDSATSMFGTPMFLISRGQAMRSFSDEVNKAEAGNQLYVHSSDFDLYLLGSWDADTAAFELFERAELVVRGRNARIVKE